MSLLETRELHTALKISGMTCADCAEKMVGRVRGLPGVRQAALSFAAGTLVIEHDGALDEVLRVIHEAGYDGKPAGEPESPASAERHFLRTRRHLLATLASGALLALAVALQHTALAPPPVIYALYLAVMVCGGAETFRRGLISLRTLTFDMNALMTIAVAGALVIHEWPEAATVAFLYAVSNMLEAYTLEKTRKSIREVLELAPREALVRRHGVEMRLPVAQVRVGEIVIVKPGEKIPVDGAILAGSSAISEAAITGEATPVERGVGDPVYAGTLNAHGALEVRVTAPADDTRLAHIIHLVEEAQARRAPSQSFVDRFARVYTPAVLALAAVLAVAPPLLLHQSWIAWFARALSLVVVACPCALVISTPVAIISALGNAARHGVLIKGGAYLEQAGNLSVVAFDKTGTLTHGRPEVTRILPLDGVEAEDVLRLAAAVEARAAHPLAEAILRRAREARLTLPPATLHAALPGRGARALVDGEVIHVGAPRLFAELGIALDPVAPLLAELEQQGHTVVLVGNARGLLGVIAAADTVRPESRAAITALHHSGIRRVVMLTGDNPATARAIAADLGIDDFRANLLPEEKLRAIHDLRAEFGAVAMVGDGINDAPALATATVGIAMGAGTDTALETADIALMGDDLSKVPYAMRLSRKALRIIRQNIWLAIMIKVIAVALVFPGWLTLPLAILADMGATLLVTLNGLRLVNGTVGEGGRP